VEVFFPVSEHERDALLAGRFVHDELAGQDRIEWENSGAYGDAHWVIADVPDPVAQRSEDPDSRDLGYRPIVLPRDVLNSLAFREVSVPEIAEADSRLERYVEAAEAHAEASASGDSGKANKAHNALAEIYRELRREGSEERLSLLLRHPNPAVGAWSGAHALEFAPEEAKRVLEDLAKREDLIGFNAQQTLAVWREGKLSFP
jgi:hypothetical protein